MRSFLAPVALALLCAWPSPSAAAAEYRFTPVANPASPFPPSAAAINGRGEVAFVSATDATGTHRGVYVSSGGVVRKLIDTTGPFSSFSQLRFNDTGAVAVRGGTDAGESGVFVITPDGGFARVAPPPGFTSPSSHFEFNNNGQVAFEARRLSDLRPGYFVTDGSAVTTIITWSGSEQHHPSFALNDHGVVAFTRPDIPGRLYTGDGGPVTTAHNGYFPSINNAGRIAFTGALTGTSDAILVTTADGGVVRIAGDDDYGTSVIAASINEAGDVAFYAHGSGPNEGRHSISVGDGTRLDRVISTGDALFGSTVTQLSFMEDMMSDGGEIVFAYRLADFRFGIAVASPVPEPASAAVLGLLPCALLARRHRRAATLKSLSHESEVARCTPSPGTPGEGGGEGSIRSAH